MFAHNVKAYHIIISIWTKVVDPQSDIAILMAVLPV